MGDISVEKFNELLELLSLIDDQLGSIATAVYKLSDTQKELFENAKQNV